MDIFEQVLKQNNQLFNVYFNSTGAVQKKSKELFNKGLQYIHNNKDIRITETTSTDIVSNNYEAANLASKLIEQWMIKKFVPMGVTNILIKEFGDDRENAAGLKASFEHKWKKFTVEHTPNGIKISISKIML